MCIEVSSVCLLFFYLFTYFFFLSFGEESGNQIHINKLNPFLAKLVWSSRGNIFLITGLD